MVWVSTPNRKITCCTLHPIKTEIQVFGNIRGVKYVGILVSSDPYIFPYKAESSILSLYRKIRVSESPYCHIFYAVMVFILIYKHQGYWSTMHHWMHLLQPYAWMTAVKFVEYKENIKKCTTNWSQNTKHVLSLLAKSLQGSSPNLFWIWYKI